MEGCLWLENLNGRSFKTFPKRKDPALFFKGPGLGLQSKLEKIRSWNPAINSQVLAAQGARQR